VEKGHLHRPSAKITNLTPKTCFQQKILLKAFSNQGSHEVCEHCWTHTSIDLSLVNAYQ
jgi:hypothetical protein